MYDEIPSLLYVAGALIAVLSWTLFAFSKTIRPEGRRAFILCLSVIWILFFASSTLALVPYPLFEAYSGFMDPDVLESVHVETDRNPLVFPFKTTQSLPFSLRPADEPHFFCLKRRKPGCQR